MDAEALFLELFEQNYERVFRRFRRRGLPREEARDLAQETFVRVFKGMPTYRGQGSVAYVTQVAENTWKNHLRYWAAESRAGEEVEAADITLGPAAAATIEDRLVDKERGRLLDEAIAGLSPRMQHCLRLWVDGLKYREIAAVLDISIDAVKSLVYQAKRRLHERLGESALPLERM